jgi:hypothetical protein
MCQTPLPLHSATSLWRRRVRYPAAASERSEGFVTRHDLNTRTVIVLDIADGSFWRGSAADIEVIV